MRKNSSLLLAIASLAAAGAMASDVKAMAERPRTFRKPRLFENADDKLHRKIAEHNEAVEAKRREKKLNAKYKKLKKGGAA